MASKRPRSSSTVVDSPQAELHLKPKQRPRRNTLVEKDQAQPPPSAAIPKSLKTKSTVTFDTLLLSSDQTLLSKNVVMNFFCCCSNGCLLIVCIIF